MRILITGAGGQIGRDLARVCADAGDEVTGATHAELDVTDRDQVLGAVGALRPQVIVNCAAWTAVDACESDPARALRHNALSVRWLAEGARRFDAHLIQLSTDYVFAGDKPEPYDEWDETGPRSAYGRTKLAGEREALLGVPGACVVRTAWVCGEHGGNMVKTVLSLLRADPTRQLAFVDDQRGCPSFAADLALGLRGLAVSRVPGVVHLTNAGAVSWYEFVCEILEVAGFSPAQCRPITTADLQPPRPAPRPANSVLDNRVLRELGMPLLRHHAEPLRELLKTLQAE